MAELNRDEVRIDLNRVTLEGSLRVPQGAKGLVVFAHGSGSGRLSERNRFVATRLNQAGFATLLFDLLTHEEENTDRRTGELRFDIPLLADRLALTIDWVVLRPRTASLRVGLFGASTGAAAALLAAARRPYVVQAVVSRGGRPDLAAEALPYVRAPTLLIVGANDVPVMAMNERAASELVAPHRLDVVPGATHLFEEPGKLEIVADLAAGWFRQHLLDEQRSSAVSNEPLHSRP
jgi:putative phosphoribosyl transferase